MYSAAGNGMIEVHDVQGANPAAPPWCLGHLFTKVRAVAVGEADKWRAPGSQPSAGEWLWPVYWPADNWPQAVAIWLVVG